MVVPVRLPGILREFADGEAVLKVPLEDHATVGALFTKLAAERPALERRIRDERGRLRPHVNVFVGDTNAKDAGGLEMPIPPDTEIAVIPAVSGG
jgi:molybdopterin converting factor small subunit